MQTKLSNTAYILDNKAINAGWSPVYPAEGKRVCCYEKDLGILARIWDLAKRNLKCVGFEPEGSLDTIRIFNCFYLQKFWSGKRIYIIEGCSLGQDFLELEPSKRLPVDGSEQEEVEGSLKQEVAEGSSEQVLRTLSSVKDTASEVRKISSPILNIARGGSPTCFLEQVSEKWTVRDPSEPNRIFRNPKKTDPTSRLRENLASARAQQAEQEKRIKSTLEKRQRFFASFLDTFNIKDPLCQHPVKKYPRHIVTDCNKTTGSKVLKVQGYSYGISSTIRSWYTMEEEAHAVFELDGHPCFAVFEGHGGFDDPEYCAVHMPRILGDYLKQSGKALVELNDSELILFFKKAFILLDAEAKSAKEGEGLDVQVTTVALSVVIGDRLICVNLGDSRVVVINHDGEAIQVTLDAKCTDPKYSKVVTENGGYISGRDNRVNGYLAVPRDIGGGGLDYCMSPVPTLSESNLGKFIILASDGLWDVITPLEAGELLGMMEGRGYDVDAMSQALVKLAFIFHTTDNVSVIVVKTGN